MEYYCQMLFVFVSMYVGHKRAHPRSHIRKKKKKKLSTTVHNWRRFAALLVLSLPTRSLTTTI